MRLVGAILVVGLMAVTANAGMLTMDFGGATEITAAPSDNITVDLNLSLGGGFPPFLTADDLSAVGFTFEANSAFEQVGTVVGPTGWEQGLATVDGVLDGVNQRWTVGAIGAGDTLTGPTDVFLGQAIIHVADGTPVGDYTLNFYQAGISIVSAGGALWSYNPDSAGYGGNNFDFGGGLVVHVVPEPGSLALLALGGLALIRRR